VEGTEVLDEVEACEVVVVVNEVLEDVVGAELVTLFKVDVDEVEGSPVLVEVEVVEVVEPGTRPR
jgi:hypothetical protein